MGLFLNLPVLWRVISIVSVLAGLGGSFAWWSAHQYDKGWNAAVSSIAAKDKKALSAVEKATSDVEECYRNNGAWDSVNGVCGR